MPAAWQSSSTRPPTPLLIEVVPKACRASGCLLQTPASTCPPSRSVKWLLGSPKLLWTGSPLLCPPWSHSIRHMVLSVQDKGTTVCCFSLGLSQTCLQILTPRTTEPRQQCFGWCGGMRILVWRRTQNQPENQTLSLLLYQLLRPSVLNLQPTLLYNEKYPGSRRTVNAKPKARLFCPSSSICSSDPTCWTSSQHWLGWNRGRASASHRTSTLYHSCSTSCQPASIDLNEPEEQPTTGLEPAPAVVTAPPPPATPTDKRHAITAVQDELIHMGQPVRVYESSNATAGRQRYCIVTGVILFNIVLHNVSSSHTSIVVLVMLCSQLSSCNCIANFQ